MMRGMGGGSAGVYTLCCNAQLHPAPNSVFLPHRQQQSHEDGAEHRAVYYGIHPDGRNHCRVGQDPSNHRSPWLLPPAAGTLQGDGCRTSCSASVSPLTTTPQPLRLDSPNLPQVCKPQEQELFGRTCLGSRRSEPGACFCCYLKGNARRSLDSGVKPAVKHLVIYVADVGHHAGFSQPNKSPAEPASQPHRAGSHGKQSSAHSLFLSEASRSVSRTAPGVFTWFSVGSQTLATTPGSLVMCTGTWEGETKSPLHQCRSLPAAGGHRNMHLRARTWPSEPHLQLIHLVGTR